MSIYKSAVQKPITTIMVFIAVIVFGLYSLVNLSVDLYPEIEFPAITVFTTYPGANAADIETNISKPIEDVLNTVDNLKQVSSVSRDNLSIVTLEFEYETDLSEATNSIRDALSLIERSLPEEAEKPMIFKFSSNMIPILMFAITADESYEGIEKILENRIVNPLNRINGIGSIGVLGAPIREVSIDVDPIKLDAYNITVEQIAGILRAENLNMPSGNIKMGQSSYPLRIEGEFTNSNLIKDVILGSFNGQTIYVKDVATVTDSIKEMTMDEKINGQQGVRMMILKQSGANTVEVAEDIKKELEKLKKDLPADIEIHTVFDTSSFINYSINNLSNTLLYALVFVVFVVLLFLGRWRATIIVVITIPISLIVSFIYLYVTGNSINIISLSALSIAIGMVVDDAIVVLENIAKHIDRGATPREAAVYATNEVWLAVIVTTLTVVAVFFPMTMISGMTGIMFRQLGWIVTITVVTSTIVAITLTPMLSSKMLRLRNNNSKKSWYERNIMPTFDKIDLFYGKTLKWCINHKLVVSTIAIAIFILSLFMAGGLGTEFIPESDEGRITLAIELQSGTRVEKTADLARKIESYINTIPEVSLIATSAGSDEEGGFMSMFQSTGTNIMNIMVSLKDLKDRDRSVWEIGEIIRKKLEEYPEIVLSTITFGGGGMGAGNTVDVSIYGHDIDLTTRYANEVAEKLKKVNGARDIKISREKSKPELRVELDRDKMASVGLNTATVSTALYNRVAGITASKFREDGNEYDIKIRLKKDKRNSITDIENISFTTHTGQRVKLSEIGEVKEFWTPPNIERKQRGRIVTISATPYNVPLGNLANDIVKTVEEIDFPQELSYSVGGAYEDMQDGFIDMFLLLMLSLILVYLVMASQFESLKMPFIIMFSIPFAFSGVIFALLITDTTLSIIAALGAVMLIGIVVKNAIVLVDYINLMRDRGYSLNKAIILSGQSRLRPVLMTAFTTILGMLPLALSTGEGAEIWAPMGISVIGGLLFSTIITLVIVPVVYKIFAAKGERNKLKNVNKQFAFLDN
jgi:hydrophobic/amphiphilic exporter-1 (mainly G- bacteria), HAE1 family